MTKLIFGLAVLSLSTPAFAVQETDAAACSREMGTVIAVLERAEASDSTGQLEACIPSKKSGYNSSNSLAEFRAAKEKWDASMQQYAAANPGVVTVSQYNDHGYDHVCDAPADVKSAVPVVNKEIAAASDGMREGETAYTQAAKNFKDVYKSRWRKPESYTTFRMPKNCKDTQRNVKEILKAIGNADTRCESASSDLRKTSESVASLNDVLARGCKIVKERCEAVSMAGDRSGYKYAIDIYDKYGTLVSSKDYTVDTQEEKADAMDRDEFRCNRNFEDREK